MITVKDVVWAVSEMFMFLALFKLIILVITSLFYDKGDSPYDMGESPEDFSKRHDIL